MPGTPQLKVQSHYDAAKQTYTLTLSQSCKPGAGQNKPLPFHIPFAVGLLDALGRDMALHLEGFRSAKSDKPGKPATTCVLELTQAKQTFTFNQVKTKPTPSLLRNFSAPVVMEYDYTDWELALLMVLVNTGSKTAQQPLKNFYRDSKNEALVVDKWFSLLAVAMHTDVKAVRRLMTHPAFTLKNPNAHAA